MLVLGLLKVMADVAAYSPRLERYSQADATRCLCHAVHIDQDLRDYVLHTVVQPHLRAVCPAYGVDLVAVARHAVQAQRRWNIHGYALIVIRLILLLAVVVAVLTSRLNVAAGVFGAALVAAWFILFWAFRADRLSALRAVTDSTPPMEQANPIPADAEERLSKLARANVITYAEGEGDPFIGSGRRLHWYQLTPIDITRPGRDPAGNQKTVQAFDAVMLNHHLATHVQTLGFDGLHVRNRLYVRGDQASKVTGLLPDQLAAPEPVVGSKWVKSGVRYPTKWARTYICMERVMSGGDLVVSMYVRAWVDHNLLSLERIIYFLPPLQRRYRPTREFVAGNTISVTIDALGAAARKFMPVLAGRWVRRLHTSTFGGSRQKSEARARREIKAGMIHDYGARTSLREAVAAYGTTENFEEADILDSAKRLDRRLMDCIEKFLDHHGVDTSDFRDQVELINTSISKIGTVQAVNVVVGGQGNIISGHGAVNNFGTTIDGSGSITATGLDIRDSTVTNATYSSETVRRAQGFAGSTVSRDRSDYVPPDEPVRPGSAPTGEPRQRYLLGQCPDTVAPGRPFSLLVRIATSGGGAGLKAFDVPPEGLDVLIVVHAPGMRVLGGERRTLRVPADGDSEPVMFELQADAPGAARISVTAWQGGNYLGELPVEVTALRGAAETWPHDTRAALAGDTADGVVTLEVRYDPARQVYHFQFHDIDNPRAERHSLSYDPGPLVESLVNDLDSLAQGRVGYSAAETRDYLIDAGARLWQQLLPQQVRDQFWERQHRIRQLTIIADRDAVPWELLYPMDRGRDMGFLVEQFPVTRDLFDRPPLRRSLRLRPARFVLPSGSPAAAADEIAALSRLIDAGPPAAPVLAGFTPLRELITHGDFGLLHFACHNRFSPVGGPSINLDSRPFTVTNMETARINRTLQPSAPLVFINACRTAGLAATYNRLDGWADAFMQAGAGAFVGSLWSVTDDVARDFASEFYAQLTAGRPLGEAVAAARRAAASQPGDPTWLAYTVYGHPRATLARV
jgi:CHAT domain